MLIILVLVVLVERNFSKLNIIKIYLRLTKSQGRLNGLVLLYIKKEI